MKRFGHLFEKIVSIENLNLADEIARKKKHHTHGVLKHDKNKDENILNLHKSLINKTFTTSEYNIFTVKEPKERLVYNLPYYPDRIIHHAIMNIIEPIWVNIFPFNCFACLKGRGTSGCAKYISGVIKYFSKSKDLYCLKIDIKKFYPSINHNKLKEIVRTTIKDNDLLWLIDDIIDSIHSDVGIPIGNYVSQFFANLYISKFMHYCIEELSFDVQKNLNLEDKPIIKSASYCDDIVFISDRKDVLWETFNIVKNKIENDLLLTVKHNYQLFRIANNSFDKHGRALDYVGFCFFRRQKRIRKRIKQNFCRKAKKLDKIENLTDKDYKRGVAGYLGWAYHSNSKNLLNTIITRDVL